MSRRYLDAVFRLLSTAAREQRRKRAERNGMVRADNSASFNTSQSPDYSHEVIAKPVNYADCLNGSHHFREALASGLVQYRCQGAVARACRT